MIPCVIWLFFAIKKISVVSIVFAATFSFVAFIFFFTSLCKIFAVVYCDKSYENYKIEFCNDADYVQVYEGLQGSGKSDTAKINTVIRAEYMWDKICSEYKLMTHQFLSKSDDPIWFSHFQEIKSTYDYYNNNPQLFPCIISNVPLKVFGRNTIKFSPSMLTQNKKVAYGSTILLDELKNSGLSNKYSGKLPREVDEFLRYGRQFAEIKIFGTDQNKMMCSLEMRNVAVNYTMVSMKNCLTPKLLNCVLDFMIRRFNKKYEPVSFDNIRVPFLTPIVNHDDINLDSYFRSRTKQAMRISRLADIVNSIGFVKYVRAFRGSTQGNTANDSNESVSDSYIIGRKKIWKYFCPIIRPYQSESRMFKDIYKAKDKDIEYDCWNDSMLLSREQWDELSAEIENIAKKT